MIKDHGSFSYDKGSKRILGEYKKIFGQSVRRNAIDVLGQEKADKLRSSLKHKSSALKKKMK